MCIDLHWRILNLFVANLPVLLLLVAIYLPNPGKNKAFKNTDPDTYYAGDSSNSERYNLTAADKDLVDRMWRNGTGETKLKKFLRDRSAKFNHSTILCGFRWEFKGAEIGAYCYDGKVKTDYSTPNIISFARSSLGVEKRDIRVALETRQDPASQYHLSWVVKMGESEYSAFPIENFKSKDLGNSDYVSEIKCRVGNSLLKQLTCGWALFDIGGKLEDVKRKSAHLYIPARGSRYQFGTIFKLQTSYTSIAGYCDIVKDNRIVVGWAGTYYSENSKSIGFLYNYWPLLLMYMLSLTITGDCFREKMFTGYDAFVHTGSASTSAIQILAFNERLYHILYNLLGHSYFETYLKYLYVEVILIALTFCIFQAFVIAVIVKAALGRNFSSHCFKFRVIAGFANFTALVVYLLLQSYRDSIGLNRDCGFEYRRCFFPYNSTKGFILINICTHGLQALICYVLVYRLRQSCILGSTQIVPNCRPKPTNDFRQFLPITEFEKYCLNCGIGEDISNTNIYVVNGMGIIHSRAHFIRFHGFTQIENLGIIRTKDLWIIYAAALLPKSIKRELCISLILWKSSTPNRIIPSSRAFFDFLDIDLTIKAINNDIQ